MLTMLKLIVRYLLFLGLIIGSCNKKTEEKGLIETSQDSLAVFPPGTWMTFVNINANDQIALLFQRDTLTTFIYRIELLRKWKGLPLDHGVLQLQKIEADSIYIFAGGNSECDVTIKIYNDKSKFEIAQAYVKLERNCKDDSLDIAADEFKKLLYK